MQVLIHSCIRQRSEASVTARTNAKDVSQQPTTTNVEREHFRFSTQCLLSFTKKRGLQHGFYVSVGHVTIFEPANKSDYI